MIDCTRALASMLEVELAELGAADTDLGRHIAKCDDCSAAARRILDAHAALDQALGAAPLVDAAAIVARARIGVQAGGSRTTRVRSRWAARVGWASLMAAASIAALVLLSEREPVTPGVEWVTPTATFATVEAPAGRNVAVIQTDNPDITVLWFF